MDAVSKLARTLQDVAAQAEQTEAVAARILGIIRDNDIRKLDAFDSCISAAYARNGWNATRGRPKAGAEGKPVPGTVKTYVSTVRAALRERLQPWKFGSFYELRTALAEARQRRRQPAANDGPPQLRGVKLQQADALTGALFHDLAVVHQRLDAGQRETLERQLARILATYSKRADVEPAQLPAAA